MLSLSFCVRMLRVVRLRCLYAVKGGNVCNFKTILSIVIRSKKVKAETCEVVGVVDVILLFQINDDELPIIFSTRKLIRFTVWFG